MREGLRVHWRGHLDLVHRVATIALLFSACGTNDSVVELARIEFYHDPAMIEAPTSVGVGQAFIVRVMSYGGGCISPERTDVEQTSDGADVRPFDRRHIPGENEGCTDELQLFPHETTLAFDAAGSKTIRVHGRRVDFQLDEAIQVPLSIVVE